ncbi:type II secretion system minor pseudopilin [Desulforegula conservatrix]|uniref:general secretion pathway protein GspK n=1 Tax=Desulforegula conservatrix TaxID=153026 RepID=UPI0004004406|nr:type II secretion system protein GspK [Desulforegula conservatrix]
MKKKKHPNLKNNEKGIALVITLAVVAAILSAAIFINTKVRRDFEAAAVSKERGQMRAMTSSGISAAMALLIKDRKDSNIDTLQEDWANPEFLEGVTQALAFEKGRVRLRISDEKAKIQVNALVNYPEARYFNETQQAFWIHFLDLAIKSDPDSPESTRPESFIEPLKDWLDSGDDEAITGTEGAEDAYYRSLENPYPCKNGRLAYVDEIFLVKNLGREKLTKSGLSDPSEIFSVHCGIPGQNNEGLTFDGKININTASQVVIAGILPEGKEGLAAEIASFRNDKIEGSFVNDLEKANWYKSVPGCEDLTIKPELITLSSDFFRIDAAAEMEGGQGLCESVIVQRVKNNDKQGSIECRVLSRWFSHDMPLWIHGAAKPKNDES